MCVCVCVSYLIQIQIQNPFLINQQINQNVCFVGSLEIRFDLLGVFLYLLYSMYCIWFMYVYHHNICNSR